MNHTKILTDIVASEIVSQQMKRSTYKFNEVVDSMNLKILASRICQFHELDIADADINVCVLGAVMTAQITLFPNSFTLDGLTESWSEIE